MPALAAEHAHPTFNCPDSNRDVRPHSLLPTLHGSICLSSKLGVSFARVTGEYDVYVWLVFRCFTVILDG